MICRANVKNVPAYAERRRYIVATLCGRELWFWAAWDDKAKAQIAMDNSNDSTLVILENGEHEHE